MEEKYVIHMYKFNVYAIDRRDGSIHEMDIILPFPVEKPEDLQTSYDEIRENMGQMGYSTQAGNITYIGQQAIGINLAGAYTGNLEDNITLLQEEDIYSSMNLGNCYTGTGDSHGAANRTRGNGKIKAKQK